MGIFSADFQFSAQHVLLQAHCTLPNPAELTRREEVDVKTVLRIQVRVVPAGIDGHACKHISGLTIIKWTASCQAFAVGGLRGGAVCICRQPAVQLLEKPACKSEVFGKLEPFKPGRQQARPPPSC